MSEPQIPFDAGRELSLADRSPPVLADAFRKFLRAARPWAIGLIVYAVSATLYVIAIALGTGTPLSKLF